MKWVYKEWHPPFRQFCKNELDPIQLSKSNMVSKSIYRSTQHANIVGLSGCIGKNPSLDVE